MKQLISIQGQTSSGKSELAVQLAHHIGKDSTIIINCDSRQVYKGLHIGTGMVPGEWINSQFIYKEITHELIDFIPPEKRYTLHDFIVDFNEVIKKLPHITTFILCGGTGLWSRAITHRYELDSITPEFTHVYEKYKTEIEHTSLHQLRSKYKHMVANGAEKLNSSDERNARRLQNFLLRTQVANAGWGTPLVATEFDSVLECAIDINQDILKKKIRDRFHERFNSGLLDEITQLQLGKRCESLGLEYRLAWKYLQGSISFEEMKEQMLRENLKYAKRQKTWITKHIHTSVSSLEDVIELL